MTTTISALHALYDGVFVSQFGGGVFNQTDHVSLVEMIIRRNQKYLMNIIYSNDYNPFGQFDFIHVGL